MVVSGQSMRCPLYSQGKSSQYPLDRRLGGPKSQSGCFGENALDPAGIESQIMHPHLVTIPTKLAPDCLDSPSICPKSRQSKISNAMFAYPSYHFRNGQCYRHRNSIVLVVHYPVLQLCFQVWLFCITSMKKMLILLYSCKSCLLH